MKPCALHPRRLRQVGARPFPDVPELPRWWPTPCWFASWWRRGYTDARNDGQGRARALLAGRRAMANGWHWATKP